MGQRPVRLRHEEQGKEEGQVKNAELRHLVDHDDPEPASAVLGLPQLQIMGSMEHLMERIRRGIPCPLGWLHKGPVAVPAGAGHWSRC